MKMKKILLIMLSLFTVMTMQAQSTDDEDFGSFDTGSFAKDKNYAFFLGPKVGATVSTLSQPSYGKLGDGAGFGFSAGLAMKARFGHATENTFGGTGFLGVGLELKYTSNSMATKATDQDGKENASLSLDYFDIPVYLQVYPLAKISSMNTFYIEAGVNFGVLAGRKPNTLTTEDPEAMISKVVYNIDNDGSKLKGGNISPLIGIGYTIPGTGLDINARYNIGMTKLAGNFDSKVSSFQISLAWLFNLTPRK